MSEPTITNMASNLNDVLCEVELGEHIDKIGRLILNIINADKDQIQALTEAEKSFADSKARERRYKDALEKIAQQKTHEWDGESLFSYIIAEQALQDIPEEQS